MSYLNLKRNIKETSEQPKTKSLVSKETTNSNRFASEWKKPEFKWGIVRNSNYKTELDEMLELDPESEYVEKLVNDMKKKAKIEWKETKHKNKSKADYYASKLEEGLEFLFE